ncbi:hypothetical protein D918_07123 [Trichuris suis]|nr:hypothetical protein D918_07123 [Trichuris suis]
MNQLTSGFLDSFNGLMLRRVTEKLQRHLVSKHVLVCSWLQESSEGNFSRLVVWRKNNRLQLKSLLAFNLETA